MIDATRRPGTTSGRPPRRRSSAGVGDLASRGYLPGGFVVATKAACPCCRSLTVSARGQYQLCPVCFWCDDGRRDASIHDARGGPNGLLSLEEARRNFAAFGACEERFRVHVRSPPREEMQADG